MFNNSFDYIDRIASGVDPELMLENRPEQYHAPARPAAVPDDRAYRQSRVDSMLWAYRDIGYLYAKLNPLGESYELDFTRLPEFREGSYHRLTLEEFGLSEADLGTEFFGGIFTAGGARPLRDIIMHFRKTYCSSVGVEFLHIQNKDIREWLIRRMESAGNITEFSVEQKRTILRDLMMTEEMENMLHRTFLGEKRFSIQGADAVIPALHFLADSAQRFGVEEIVMGTSHRGRLSILNLILNQSPEDIFHLFEENFVPGIPGGSGDVRYHIGYCTRHLNEDGSSVNITLLPNSSHLESVDAVVEGNARGLQDLRGDYEGKKVMPVLLHGDASFAGQGVVAETFNLSGLRGYSTGGTIHIVVNNQVGFTTPATGGRSGLNPTDIAKAASAPILHVNGDDPEAVVHVTRLAMEYRQAFHRDVVVDIICYRRFGHNEGDEPSFTQPGMYALIKDHETVAALYRKKCASEGTVAGAEIEEMRAAYRASLASALGEERRKFAEAGKRAPVLKESEDPDAATAVGEPVLVDMAKKLYTVPLNFDIHPRLKRIIEGNYTRFREQKLVDWAMAEQFAFGTLLLEGVPVRLSGQDSERGTFSQRHLAWWEAEKEACCHYIPLENLSPGQAVFSVFNSPLSEYSVLAFEYGYATARRDALVLWEAQFGDFVNGAQIVIDNYLIAARSKWNIKNGLVLLLPHGFEGMGPEHSSAHMERFLQLCSDNNLRVCNVSTPAQYFHLLRRQKKLREQVPLIIMTPKSLLRYAPSFSQAGELTAGEFRRVIEHIPGSPDRLLFCSGKIYYDLMNEMDDTARMRVGIVRVEQLYPFPEKELDEVLGRFGSLKNYYWVQEEPRNRGAWRYVREEFERHFPEIRLKYIGREASASPAAGSLKLHNEEQRAIAARAVKDLDTIGIAK